VLSSRRAQTLPRVVLFIVRVSDYDICGLSPSLMSWFIVLYTMVLLSSPWARQLYRIEMLRLTGRNKRDTIPQDSASWKQSWPTPYRQRSLYRVWFLFSYAWRSGRDV